MYDKLPRETIITEGKEIGLTKWQEQWTSSTKGAVSKLFCPSIRERMKTMLPMSLEFTGVVTGHGLTLRRLMSYMEHLFLMFLDHTQRRSTVGRTPLDE